MKPRTVARATAVTAWCTGMALILDGWTLPGVLAVTAGIGVAVFAFLRWARGWLAGLKVTVQLRRSIGKAVSAVVPD